jgi:hypothetical protein
MAVINIFKGLFANDRVSGNKIPELFTFIFFQQNRNSLKLAEK